MPPEPEPGAPATPDPQPPTPTPEVQPAADDPVTAHTAGDDPLSSLPDPTLMWVDFF
jgi:hypothetical protein